MFGFAEWDSPLSLLLEFLLAVAVVVIIMWLARLAKVNDTPPGMHTPDETIEKSARTADEGQQATDGGRQQTEDGQ